MQCYIILYCIECVLSYFYCVVDLVCLVKCMFLQRLASWLRPTLRRASWYRIM